MAHYAILDENGVVTNVIVGKDEGLMDWENFYSMQMGVPVKRTSYNTKAGVYYNPQTGLPDDDQSKAFRKNYAGKGFTYDATRDAFIPPKTYNSWVLDEDTCEWVAPVALPSDHETKDYDWDEDNLQWREFIPS